MTQFEGEGIAPEPVTPQEGPIPETQSFADARTVLLESARIANTAGVRATLVGNMALADAQFALADRLLTDRSRIKPQR